VYRVARSEGSAVSWPRHLEWLTDRAVDTSDWSAKSEVDEPELIANALGSYTGDGSISRVRCREMSGFAKAVIGLVALLVVLAVALVVEGATHNAIAAWVAVVTLFVVMIARWLLLA
jgi:hypothetical protein